MDKDPRNHSQQDFWSFCDSINAGNCRFAVSEALRRMYGIKHDLDSLPPMPMDGNTWSVMNSWAMPTRSFLEFIMFSRMFVDALDAQMYDEHHQSGHCYLSLHKDRHCYSRVLELLVNVWAYHSARRMVYINHGSGELQEKHKLKSRRGHMWIKWFSYTTLKSMDEDLAEEFDTDHPTRRWLWPSTGEVFWHGLYEREQKLRHRQKEKRKQQSKDKISRMRKRSRQKTIGKYIKPPPEDRGNSSATTL
ncbi:Glycosyl transferase, family 1 protein [Thalictrum thalictroides]|uniref:Glycosyl transferase, family 1 protein n=1 Tax=Thalictrum thalictroides TaxID=46969 RepID=A0A7J6VM30_THATH|nr:Glycosyl transferase, family 1 protein [Thalictrum thalictroides]